MEGGYCLSVFGQVGGRERERAREKTNSKTFFPCYTSKGKRRTVPFKTTPFQASPFFFYGDPKMGYNNIVCINSKHSS
jgi:hypothetical protein